MEIPQFPEFTVPGVPVHKLFMLYGASNFNYYVEQVADARSGRCPFCPPIDLKKNRVLVQFDNPSWLVWDNLVAPRADQEHQFLLTPKHHIHRFSELTPDEVVDLLVLFQKLDGCFMLQYRGTDIVSRCAYDMEKAPEGSMPFALGTAQSIGHYHINYHVPTGLGEVKVTLAKTQEDLLKKREVLKVWEKMRLAKEAGNLDPMNVLDSTERALVDKKIKPPPLK
jgi:hypothetical protein